MNETRHMEQIGRGEGNVREIIEVNDARQPKCRTYEGENTPSYDHGSPAFLDNADCRTGLNLNILQLIVMGPWEGKLNCISFRRRMIESRRESGFGLSLGVSNNDRSLG
jgi:hypothetical protein